MKTTFTMKRFLSILLVFLMIAPGIVQLVAAVAADTYSSKVSIDRIEGLEVPSIAQSIPEDGNWIEEQIVAITVGGKRYDPENAPIDYQEGTNISARFDWKIKNGETVPEQYVYSLGDFKPKADYKGGLLVDQNGHRVGDWLVVRDTETGENKLIFTFEDWFRSKHTKERYFWVQLDGTIPLDPPGTGNSDRNRFQIGEEWVDMNLKYQQGGVDLSKDIKDLKIDTDGFLFYTASITATVKGYIKDLKLIDRLQFANSGNPPAYSKLYSMENLGVQVNGKNLDSTYYTVVDYSAVSDSRRNEPWGFELTFNDNMVFNAGDKITVTYTFKMTNTVLGSPTYFPAYNTVGAECVDIPTGGDIKCAPKDAPVNLDNLKLTLNKSGERDTADPGLIKWTLTIDTGIAAPAGAKPPTNDSSKHPLRIALVNLLKKKYPNLNLNDVLGDGHDFTDPTIKGQIGNPGYFTGGFLMDPTIAKIVVNNNKWSFVCEYTTRIKNVDGISEYTNEATLRDDRTDIATSGPVGLPVYTLDKSAIYAEPTVDPQTGIVTMPWQIVTRIPGPGFGSFTIVDNPENDNIYNDGYTHRYKAGSLKVYISSKPNSKGSPWDPWPDWLEFTETDNGGFRLTVNENKGYWHQYLFLVYETEVVDAQGNHVDFTDHNYQWKNTTSIEGKDIEDSDIYAPISKESAAPTIAKGAIKNEVEEATGDYIFTWLISVNNIPVVARNSGDWTESWGDVSSIDLTDTIPNGHIFEKGSLAATLYKGSGTSISSKNVISSESIPNISEWLSKNLTYNDTGANVSMTWSAPDGECQYLYELEALSNATTEKYYLALEYKTRLVNHATLVNGNTTFKNSVGGKVNDKDVVGANASAQVKPGNFGAKTYAYQSDWVSAEYPGEGDWMYTVDENGAANPNMRFTIEINQPGLTASTNNRGIVYLEDTMGSDLRLIEESVRLYNTKTEEYETVEFDYIKDGSVNKLTMAVPGGTHYTLTYWVEVCGNVGGTVSSSKHGNKVRLTLEGVSKEFTKNPSGKKYGSAAGAHATFSLTIQKVDAQTLESVYGAQFTLEYGTINSDGEFERYTQNADKGFVVSEDPDGLHYSFTNPDQLGYVFRITETKAPDDYLIGAPRYFVFTELYDGDLDALPDFVEKHSFDSGNYRFPDKHVSAEVAFNGTKQVDGRAWDDAKDNGSYAFTLAAITAGAPMPETTTVTNEGTAIRFPEIKYTEEGTYKYKITETAVDEAKAPDVSIDSNPVYVTVVVEKDSESPTGMTATVHYSRDAEASFEEGTADFTFINYYHVAEITAELYVIKKLNTSGFDIKNSYTFSFELTPNENNPADDPVEGKTITKSVTLSSPNWSRVTENFFEDLAFTKEGIYTYTLTEVNNGIESVTYDETKYTVIVEITLNKETAEPESKVTVNGEDSNFAGFTNSYDVIWFPETGGAGIYLFYAFSAVLVLSVGIFMSFAYRKKRT